MRATPLSPAAIAVLAARRTSSYRTAASSIGERRAPAASAKTSSTSRVTSRQARASVRSRRRYSSAGEDAKGGKRTSTPRTQKPAASRADTRRWPRKPPAPVTRTRLLDGSAAELNPCMGSPPTRRADPRCPACRSVCVLPVVPYLSFHLSDFLWNQVELRITSYTHG